MSITITPNFDLHRGKSIDDMIDVLSENLNKLKIEFLASSEHPRATYDDVRRICEQFREWAEDPGLPAAVNASDSKKKQMKKSLYQIGSLLETGKFPQVQARLLLTNEFLDEAWSHLYDLDTYTAEAKKAAREKEEKKESKDKKDSKDKKEKKDKK
ncbi:hypothetical protein N0V84_005401 [Fusarium piperis]|uniref:Uncharacterized protein n=1 Tax=Fusarium piperis TaxID=1435070 RepID=A0A9W9BPK5_9HYPO|nr:hypothetical protein N0V84_005401 [Fusarium piperis]